MSNVDLSVPYPHLLFAPPTDLPFGLNSGGSVFGAERVRDEGKPEERRSFHHAIDLFYRGPASIQQKAYAVSDGLVERAIGSRVWVRHHPATSGFFTVYTHLDTRDVNQGDQVRRGQQVGTISGDHLHFVWFRLADPADNYHVTTNNFIPLDPTALLYRFDANRWQWEDGTKVPQDAHTSYSQISRVRIEPWPGGTRRPATWLFEVGMEGSQYFYLPIQNALPQEELLVEVLRDAARNQNRVKLNFRDSFFYPIKKNDGSIEPRKMIEGVRVRS